jgi:hypothetical protein
LMPEAMWWLSGIVGSRMTISLTWLLMPLIRENSFLWLILTRVFICFWFPWKNLLSWFRSIARFELRDGTYTLGQMTPETFNPRQPSRCSISVCVLQQASLQRFIFFWVYYTNSKKLRWGRVYYIIDFRQLRSVKPARTFWIYNIKIFQML